jgi:phosphoglycerate kinase
MDKQTIDNIKKIKGQRILMRVDFNVPIKDGQVTDDLRIRAALPSINQICGAGGRLILMSHLGRPKGKFVAEMSLKPVAEVLRQHTGRQVYFAEDCIGDAAEQVAQKVQDGEILLLENLRFHAEEEANDSKFAAKLASLASVYVNDAFGSAHRAHASTEGVTKYFDTAYAGYLMRKELDYLGKALADPARPFVALLGGVKISGKIDVITNLFGKVDKILIGGAMAYTFIKARGGDIGSSFLEEDRLEMAGQLLREAEDKGVRLVLPTDAVCAKEIEAGAETSTHAADSIPSDLRGLDIGPNTVASFEHELADAKTIVWNGPMGVFEVEEFAGGTAKMAETLAKRTDDGAITIIGGGDSAAAIRKLDLEDKVSHVSTGGGASLEFLEGKTLPGVAALTDRQV